MKEQEQSPTLKNICPKCGKRVAGGLRSGSLTAYLFGALDCHCSAASAKSVATPGAVNAQAAGASDDDSDFCPKCGLKRSAQSRDGSLTGFLFQSTRCKCPPDKDFADGQMSARFWKLKQAGANTIFASASARPSKQTDPFIGLAPDATVGGVYKIIELIGRGGMGEVYLARHEALGKKCALKVIPPEQVTEMGWQRFQLEAKAVAKLDHINLVRVTDLGIHEGCLPFYAMDYVQGNNLAEILAEQGPMPLKIMLEIFMQVCDGVECAHRAGILHRDLKPANIMLTTAAGGAKQAKVLDFGLAKLTTQDRAKQSLTAIGDLFGSPFYMSPEQCAGDKLDNRSDIYSLGCTMFECLTGRPPFSGHLAQAVMFSHQEAEPPSLESIVGRGRLPDAIELVLAKLLRKNPVERYQTLAQLKADLELVAAGKEVQPFYVSRTKQTATVFSDATSDIGAPPLRQPSLRLFISAGLFVLILAASVICYIVWAEQHNPRRALLIAASRATYRDARPYPGNSEPDPGDAERDVYLTDSQAVSLPSISRSIRSKAMPKWDGKPFFKSTVDVRGIRYQHFVFPREGPYPGAFTYASWPQIKELPLTGSVLVPENRPRWLIPSPGMKKEDFLFQGLRDGDFDAVNLLPFGLPDFFELLSALNKFKSIKELSFGRFKWDADGPHTEKMAIQLLNQFPSLDGLIIVAPMHADNLGQIKRLRLLREIRLQDDQPELQKCLHLLSGAQNLESFAACGWKLPTASLSLLCDCPKLRRVQVGRLHGSHEQLMILARLPNLNLLELPNLHFRPDLTADLKQFRSLKELRFDLASWNYESLNQLRRELPTVKLTGYRSFADQRNSFEYQ